MRAILILIILLVPVLTAASGQIYTYEDERGVIHFSERPISSKYIPYTPKSWSFTPSVSQIIRDCATRFKLEEALIKAVIKAESDFDPRAVSRSGAKGMMQLMDETAQDMGVSQHFDPEQNITGGSRYLRKMLDMFDNNLELALAAYNAGPTNVKNYRGIPPFEETRTYVRKVKDFLHHYRKEP